MDDQQSGTDIDAKPVRSKTSRRGLLLATTAGVLGAAGVGGAIAYTRRPVDGSADSGPPTSLPLPQAFDPLVPHARFGWTPEELAVGSIMTTPEVQLVYFNAIYLIVPALSAGKFGKVKPDWQSLDRSQWVRGGETRAGRAVDGTEGLQWEVAPGVWCSISGLIAGDVNTLVRMASDVTIGPGERLTRPVSVDALPVEATVRGVHYLDFRINGGRSLDILLTFGPEPDAGSARVRAATGEGRLGRDGKSPFLVREEPNTTVDGHRASLVRDLPGTRSPDVSGLSRDLSEIAEQLTIFDADGVTVQIGLDTPGLKEINAVTLFRSLTLTAD